MKLSMEQLNFLTRLNLAGSQHYSIFGDRVGDEEAKEQLKYLHKLGVIRFDGFEASITEQGKQLIKDETHYFK